MSDTVAEPKVTIAIDDKNADFSADTEQQIKELLHDTAVKLSRLIAGITPKPDPDKIEVQDADGEEVAAKWTVQLGSSTTASPTGPSETVTVTVGVTFG